MDLTKTSPLHKIWDRLDRSNPGTCWVWPGAKTWDGYGRVICEGIEYYTHVVAFALTMKRWPLVQVNHTCDNPPCCNPAHVYDGTQYENNLDRSIRGRTARLYGEDNHTAKLTWATVREIKRSFRSFPSNTKELARKYGVTPQTIRNIVNNKTWAEF